MVATHRSKAVHRSRFPARLGGVVLACIGLTVSVAGRANPFLSPSALWGEALYQSAQGDELGALTQALLVKQNKESWPKTEEAELWRFATLMRWGLHADASEVLTQLEDSAIAIVGPTAARDVAWFQLAEARYRKGLWLQADEALARIRKALPPEQETERRVIQAQCLMHRGLYREAAKVWKDLADAKPYPIWARYNQAQAQIKAGDKIAGLATLESVGIAEVDTEEQRQIRDKANLTMGLGALEGKHWAESRRYLERVPLQGTESNKALLAYGWVAMAQQGPQSALAPWMALLPRASHDPAVIEAQVAVAYAYASSGAKGRALQQYKQAIEHIVREQTVLDAAADRVRQGSLTQALLRISSEPSKQDWPLDAIPDGLGLPHLVHLWSTDTIQDAFQGVRDMAHLQQSVTARQARLVQIKTELASQSEIWTRLQQPLAESSVSKQLTEQRQRLDALESELVRYQAQPDPLATANDEQRAIQARIQSLQQALLQRSNVPELKALRDRLRLVQGVLTWQLHQAQQAQIQQLKQTLSTTKELGAQAQVAQKSATQSLEQGRRRIDQLTQQVEALQSAMTRLLPQVEILQREYIQVIGELTLDEIYRQRSRLQSYLTQARFAMAKLYDQAASNGGATRPMTKEAGDAR